MVYRNLFRERKDQGKIGDIKTVRKFAWWPVRLTIYLNVWFQVYYIEYRLESFSCFSKPRWKKHRIYANRFAESTPIDTKFF